MALTDNWEASWRYNNNGDDSSNNGITGIPIGATYSSSTKKLGSHAAAFDGADDAFNYGNVLNNVFAGADKKFSYSFWVYLNNLDNNQFFFNKMGDSSHSEDQRQFYSWIATDGSVVFRPHFGLGIGSAFRQYSSPASTIAAGSFHLVRITYDGSIDTNNGLDRVTMKVNNVAKTVGMSASGLLGDIQSGTARLSTGGYIGSSGSTVFGEVDGFIDQGDIWSRTLTSADDDEIWNEGVGLQPSIRTPSIFFFFDLEDRFII